PFEVRRSAARAGADVDALGSGAHQFADEGLTDAAGATGDQGRAACDFHGLCHGEVSLVVKVTIPTAPLASPRLATGDPLWFTYASGRKPGPERSRMSKFEQIETLVAASLSGDEETFLAGLHDDVVYHYHVGSRALEGKKWVRKFLHKYREF